MNPRPGGRWRPNAVRQEKPERQSDGKACEMCLMLSICATPEADGDVHEDPENETEAIRLLIHVRIVAIQRRTPDRENERTQNADDRSAGPDGGTVRAGCALANAGARCRWRSRSA